MIEVCLIILGVVVFVASFLLGEKISPEETFAKEQVTEILDKQREDTETRFHDTVRQLSEDMQEATERQLEKICNEKIMALHEDSDTTLEDIEKNHQEVVFLYSMLEDKKKELEDLTSSLRDKTKETRELVQDLMLSKDITQILEQEITMGRDTIEQLKELRDGSDEALASATERIEQLRNLDDKLIDLQQLEARISLRQKEEKTGEKPAEGKTTDETVEEKAAEKKPVKKTTTRKKTTTAKSSTTKKASEEVAPETINESVKEAEEAEKSEKSEKPEKPAPKRAPARKKKTEGVQPEEKEALLAGVAAFAKKETEPEEEAINSNEKILRMHREGMTETEIAKTLSRGVGEVKLVIDLFEGAKV